MAFVLALVLIFGLAARSFAGANDNAKIALHLQLKPTGKAPPVCSRLSSPPCNPDSVLSVHGNLQTGYDLYFVVLDGDSSAGIGGASFGISYGPNLYVGTWSLCADLEFPGGLSGILWPNSGSGNVLTWDSEHNCQRTPAPGDLGGGVTGILGSLYVYAYTEESLSVTPRNYVLNPDLQVSDCTSNASAVVFPDHAGKVGFGMIPGYDPCLEPEFGIPPSLPPPGEDYPARTWSSGYDPLLSTSWPITVLLGSDKAVVSSDHFFGAGDNLTFSYDEDSQALFLNGELWHSYLPLQRSKPVSAQGLWADRLRAEFMKLTTGTEEERVKRAFKSMDQSVLDPNFKPRVTASQVTVRFKGDRFISTILLNEPKQDSAKKAREDALGVVRGMKSEYPLVIVHYPTREYMMGGKGALEVLEVFRHQTGTLDESDLEIARKHAVLEAAQAIRKGYKR